MSARLGPALVAEFVGTFALSFVGIMAIHFAGGGNGGLLMVALAHGLILSIFVTAAMPTSGGHLNPAVTIGFLVTGKIKFPAAISYLVIQLAAATVAGLAVYALFGADEEAAKIVLAGTPNLSQDADGIASITPGTAILAEAVATFLLVFAVWGSAVDPRNAKVGGFAIGLTVAADILAIGPMTGGAVNPSRVFGPALVASLAPGSDIWHYHWVYWVGPVLGAVLAAIIYNAVLMPRDKPSA